MFRPAPLLRRGIVLLSFFAENAVRSRFSDMGAGAMGTEPLHTFICKSLAGQFWLWDPKFTL